MIATLAPLASTPYLAVDPQRLAANIASMQARADAAGVTLRPHVKTHKCLQIARQQIAAGARGITVATIGEAEVFVRAGFTDVFVAYPVWLDDDRIARLVALTDGLAHRVRVGVDSAAAAARIALAVRRGAHLEALIELDSGHHRSGVSPGAAGALAFVLAQQQVRCAGVFSFPGHSYAPGGRAAAAADEATALSAAVEAIGAAGFSVRDLVVSGGSSPSAQFLTEQAAASPLSEFRPGVYVFGDAQQWELGACAPSDIAASVHATVVSHAGGRLVLDAGSKVLGADKAAWASGFGRLLADEDARIVQCSEHHAVVEVDGCGPGRALPPLGSVVAVVPNHICNAVNLVDELIIATGPQAGQRWAVAARGANS